MFDQFKDDYENFMNHINKKTNETSTDKKAIFIKEAQTLKDEQRLFMIAFYCHSSLEKEQADQLDREWEEYFLNGKETRTPILPYYYYVLERIEFKLKK